MYKCEICQKTFDKKYNYERHMNISSNCKLFSIDTKTFLDVTDTKYACTKCGCKFSSKGNLDRHVQNPVSKCNIKDSIDQLTKKIDMALKNQNNNITVTNYLFVKPGEECVKHITKEVLLELLNMDSFTGICSYLMQDAYFNRKVPKNHNWCLAYPNNDKAAVIFDYNEEQFTRDSTSKIIDNKFNNLMELLRPVVEQIVDEEAKTGYLNQIQKKNLFRIRYFCNIDELSNESTEIYETIHKLAYSKRNIPMETWSKSGLKGNHLSLKFG